MRNGNGSTTMKLKILLYASLAGKHNKEVIFRSSSKDQAFKSRGLTNWKDGPGSFRRHEESKCHKEAYHMIVTLPNTVPSFGKCSLLSTASRKL